MSIFVHSLCNNPFSSLCFIFSLTFQANKMPFFTFKPSALLGFLNFSYNSLHLGDVNAVRIAYLDVFYACSSSITKCKNTMIYNYFILGNQNFTKLLFI